MAKRILASLLAATFMSGASAADSAPAVLSTMMPTAIASSDKVTVKTPAPVAMQAVASTGEAYFIYTDQINAAREITNAAGVKVWQADPEPFGANIPNENPAVHGQFTYNQRFPGQYFDKETGLHYNYFRDYDPQTGRYIQSDPIGLGGGINTYGYALGNPVSNTDPTGLLVPLVIAGVCSAGGCEALFVAGAAGALWWQQNHPVAGTPPWVASGGQIPPQDFPNGISWPPKNNALECRVEVPPPKLPPPQKPDCDTVFQVCRTAVENSATGIFGKFAGYTACVTALAICKKVM